MKLVSAQDEQGLFVGLLNEAEDQVLPLGRTEEKMTGFASLPASMAECIALGEEFIEKAQAVAAWAGEHRAEEGAYLPLTGLTLLAPIPRPSKNIFCVGKNYAEHAVELGSKEDIPEDVIIFTKASTSVIGPKQPIPLHSEVTKELDYEGELAVVIGKEGKGIKQEDALDHVFGYTIINDVTARDLQSRHKQYFIGKSLDGSCPMGPWIVHVSSIADPNQLNIETRVNGEIRQSSNTRQLIFSIAKIIEELSKGMTLEPGDIIATGTPAGVGKGMKPPSFLGSGDMVEITVEGIGTLSNSVR